MKLFITIFLLLTLFSCQKEDEINCDNYTKVFGPYFLEPASKSFFPYSSDIQRLVFIDSNEHEFSFELDSFFDGIQDIKFWDSCPFDSTAHLIFYDQERERIMMRFYNDSLKLSLQVSIYINTDIEDQEIVEQSDRFYSHIAVIDPIPHTVYNVGIAKVLVQKVGNIDFADAIALPSWTLFGKTFNAVEYVPTQQFYKWVIYYNNDLGVVGFEHETGSPKLVLDRIE